MSNEINLRSKKTATDKMSLIRKDIEINALLSVYPEEAYEKLLANKDKLVKISNMFSNAIGNISKAVMIMKCDIIKCPFKNSCELIKHNIAPDGYACPIEKKIANEIEIAVVDSLKIDTGDVIEMELLYDFIDAKLLDMRTSSMIAGDGLVQTIKAISEGKIVETSKDITPEFKIKMDLKKLKTNILEEFIATRKAKKKFGMIGTESAIERLVRQGMNK